MNRRQALAIGVSATAVLSAALPRRASAHNLPPGTFGSAAYTAALEAKRGTKAVFQSPNVESTVKAGNTLNHLLAVQAKNWLNGFQFSYGIPPNDLHLVVATYASANLLTYADAVWSKYRLGEKYHVTDPATGTASTRNLFWPSRFTPSATQNPDDPQSFYQDTGIEALQRRGVVFLT